MYIVLESLPFNHPVLDQKIEILDQYSFGPYTCAYIAPENEASVDLSQINYIQVAENVARAAKFGKVTHEHKIKIAVGSEVHEELIIHSMEEHAVKPQLTYTLSDADLAEVVEFWKAVMHLALSVYYKNLSQEDQDRNAALKASITSEIDACTEVIPTRALLHNRFGIATSSVVKEEQNWGEATVNLSE